MTLSGRRPTAH